VNIFGALGGQNLKFQVIFKSAVEKKEKLKKDGNFYAKLIFVFGVTQKQMTVDTI